MQSSTRGLGLGIDTGGTYTDAAIVDLKDKRVLAKAKARTTHHDLAIGVAEAADNVMRGSGLRTSDISLVGVSTTLATNSILEGAGGRVGLIGIGWTPEEGWDLGADRSVFISGGHTVKGEESSPLLMDEVLDAVEEMSEGVDAVAISSIFSVYNREHEEKVAEALTESVPLPLVLGHHLTTDLGIRERTVTAVLNARLIPLINLFLDKVESSLRERGMRAPIMVFKGDGTLMNIHTARKRPVETILSGPAASSMGGRILAGVDSCIIVDIGGTSTDIAFLEDGFPKVTREGATVGKWRTRVRAVDMWTAALGGDSEVLPGEGKVSLGSRRVIPLSMAATRWPELLDRMRGSGDISYYVAFSSEEKDLVEGEGSVFRFLLENGPATSREVQRGTGVVLVDRQLRSLAGGNMVAGIGLTPTDCLHVNGTYTQGSVEAARLGVETASRSTGLSAGEMVDEVLNRVAAGISEEIIKKVMLDEGSSPSASGG
ncbi:MAG: hydantoinase/oxoprolinase family protein, partial [Methanomassiliicoccales archaeon]